VVMVVHETYIQHSVVAYWLSSRDIILIYASRDSGHPEVCVTILPVFGMARYA